MTWLDWTILVVSAAGMMVLGWWLGRRQRTGEDYYLAGRRLGWFPVGVSTMATQLSAVSFLSAPAFVGLRPGGGLIWLGYEVAVPLAMIPLLLVLLPVFHEARVVSVYEVLERRFDARVRIAVSLVFQVSRGLAAGVMVYAGAIVVSATLGLPQGITILVIGCVALVYELFGGIHVDIVSDTIQMGVLLVGILVVGWTGLQAVGGWGEVVAALDPARLQAVDFTGHGLGDGRDFGFWPLLIGGLFLYLSYYGTDQSQVQRELSARSLGQARASLFFNGLARFPVVLAYCLTGLILGAFVVQHPGFLDHLPEGNVDYLVPVFIRDRLVPGLTGFIFVAILAAAMSSLDSAINSLSAATLEDVWKKLRPEPLPPERELLLSKGLTLFWGVVCIAFAFQVEHLAPTVLESINKIGSAFYGPVFAVFLVGLTDRRPRPPHALCGLVAGVGLNLTLWRSVPTVSWLWWNAFGFGLAAAVMVVGGLLAGVPAAASAGSSDPAAASAGSSDPDAASAGPSGRTTTAGGLPLPPPAGPVWRRASMVLAVYAVGLVLLLIALPRLLA